jgi:glutaredoxin
MVQPGTEVSINEVVEEKGLYKIVINLPDDQEFESYMTKDGETFFAQPIDMAEFEAKANEQGQAADANQQQQAANVPKAEKPKVEAFVMSHCPYGTQIEKGLIPVAKTLGDKIDFEIKFVDYAMHGEKELDEQLRQYCIQEEQNEKFLPYLECFLEDDDSERCLEETGVDVASMESCVASADTEYQVKELFADQSTWSGGRYPQFNTHKEDNEKYGVQGSPTFVVNETKVQVGRDSQTLLNTICSGFENQPEECNTQLSSAAPSPGFGWSGTGAANTAASCN